MKRMAKLLGTMACGFLIGCGGGDGSQFSFDNYLDPAGKADMISQAHVISDINLNSRIDGKFNDRIRVYGYTFSAKAGATIQVKVTTKAGPKSTDTKEGQPLDTILALYGPMTSNSAPGKQLAYVDDSNGTLFAQLPPVPIAQDGKYIAVMATWNDPGLGTFVINLGCQGTNFQCLLPVQNGPCSEGTTYIQGNEIVGTSTWDSCEVVLLENTVVQEGAVLTINPGVQVKGNYIGSGTYGTVGLVVNGTIQAVGTKEFPVVFTALKDGWKGLTLVGPSSSLENVYVEKAEIGVNLQKVTSANLRLVNINQVKQGLVIDTAGDVTIEDAVIQGASSSDGIGIQVMGTAQGKMTRSLVSGFKTGLLFDDSQFEVTQSSIINNQEGVIVTGPDAGIQLAQYQCPAPPQNSPPPVHIPPSYPTVWNRDPIFRNCDLLNNSVVGIKISAPQLVVVENSNIQNNGMGVLVEAHSVHQDSHIYKNNIFNNNSDKEQIKSYHLNGTLDISENYWKKISDPELSASWNMNNSTFVTCDSGLLCINSSNGSFTHNGYTCNRIDGSCSYYRYSCTMQLDVSWKSPFTFTGFSPTLLEAGPDLSTYSEMVKVALDLLQSP